MWLPDCIVNQNETFNIDWGVTDVVGCSASNTMNSPFFNGQVQPNNGGSGNFTTNIIGGLPDGVTTASFILDCPTNVNFTFKQVRHDQYAFSFGNQNVLIIANSNKDILMMVKVLIDPLVSETKIISDFKPIENNLFHGNIETSDLSDLSINIDLSEDFKNKTPPVMLIGYLLQK